MAKHYKLLITLDPDDLSKLDALVGDRQAQQPSQIATRAAVLRDLIRNAYSKIDQPEREP